MAGAWHPWPLVITPTGFPFGRFGRPLCPCPHHRCTFVRVSHPGGAGGRPAAYVRYLGDKWSSACGTQLVVGGKYLVLLTGRDKFVICGQRGVRYAVLRRHCRTVT